MKDLLVYVADAKDLLVYVADADAGAFMKAILERPQALGIRPIQFDVDRHPQRDGGMATTGPKLAGLRKGEYHKLLLLLDYQGSGREAKQAPDELAAALQERLDLQSWQGDSAVTVIAPELEQWLWANEGAIATYLKLDRQAMQSFLERQSQKRGEPIDALKVNRPKELFEALLRRELKRTISPRDFEAIGRLSSIKALTGCSAFDTVVKTLQGWFPQVVKA